MGTAPQSPGCQSPALELPFGDSCAPRASSSLQGAPQGPCPPGHGPTPLLQSQESWLDQWFAYQGYQWLPHQLLPHPPASAGLLPNSCARQGQLGHPTPHTLLCPRLRPPGSRRPPKGADENGAHPPHRRAPQLHHRGSRPRHRPALRAHCPRCHLPALRGHQQRLCHCCAAGTAVGTRRGPGEGWDEGGMQDGRCSASPSPL